MDDPAIMLPVGAWPPSPDLLFWASLLLVAAGLLGELVHRAWRLPRVIGYSTVGVMLTLSGHGLTLAPSGGPVRLVVDLALALLLFELGSRVNLRWLRANPALLGASLCEGAACTAGVFAALRAMGMGPEPAVACACVTMAASASVVGRVTTEARAAGQVCERVLTLTALDTLYAVLAFSVLTGWLHAESRGEPLAAIARPLYVLAGSLLVAALLAHLVARLLRGHDLSDEHAALMLLGLVVLALCVVRMFALSTLLVPLLAGVLLRHSTARPWVWPRHFGTAGGVLVLMLFVVSGSAWTVDALVQGGLAALALLGARLLARLVALLPWARPSGMELRQATALSLALSPLSGTSLVLLVELQAVQPSLAAVAAPVVCAAIAIMELLGPVAVLAGLALAGEQAPRAAAWAPRVQEQWS